MSKITLKDLFYLMSNTDNNICLTSYVNTDNDSFPDKYRHKSEYYASLFIDLSKDHSILLNKYVKGVYLLPSEISVDNPKEMNKYIMNDYGFCKVLDEGGMNPVKPAIHIVLEK